MRKVKVVVNNVSTYVTKRQKVRIDMQKKMIKLLKKNGRIPLSDMSKTLGVPISTLWDNMQIIKEDYNFTIQERIKNR